MGLSERLEPPGCGEGGAHPEGVFGVFFGVFSLEVGLTPCLLQCIALAG